jgi:hypothetical protein
VQQVAAGAVDVDEAPTRAGDLVLTGGVLLGVGDIQPPAELLDVEGRVAAGELVVLEPARKVDPVEALVEDVDASVVEVGPVQERAGRGGGDRQGLVDGVARVGVEVGGGGGTPGFQPVTSPASESNRNSAGPLASPSRTSNPGVPLNTCPVGAPPGMFTTSGAFWMGLPLTKPG